MPQDFFWGKTSCSTAITQNHPWENQLLPEQDSFSCKSHIHNESQTFFTPWGVLALHKDQSFTLPSSSCRFSFRCCLRMTGKQINCDYMLQFTKATHNYWEISFCLIWGWWQTSKISVNNQKYFRYYLWNFIVIKKLHLFTFKSICSRIVSFQCSPHPSGYQ